MHIIGCADACDGFSLDTASKEEPDFWMAKIFSEVLAELLVFFQANKGKKGIAIKRGHFTAIGILTINNIFMPLAKIKNFKKPLHQFMESSRLLKEST